jgi:hypothetical protein
MFSLKKINWKICLLIECVKLVNSFWLDLNPEHRVTLTDHRKKGKMSSSYDFITKISSWENPTKKDDLLHKETGGPGYKTVTS